MTQGFYNYFLGIFKIYYVSSMTLGTTHNYILLTITNKDNTTQINYLTNEIYI